MNMHLGISCNWNLSNTIDSVQHGAGGHSYIAVACRGDVACMLVGSHEWRLLRHSSNHNSKRCTGVLFLSSPTSSSSSSSSPPPPPLLLASAYEDGTVRVWDAITRKCLVMHSGHEGQEITCLALMHNDVVVTADVTGLFCFFSPRKRIDAGSDGASVLTSSRPLPQRKAKKIICIAPFVNRQIACGYADGSLLVLSFDSSSSASSAPSSPLLLLGHSDEVQSLRYNPAKGLLLSGSKDKTIRLWDGKGTCVATYELGKPPATVTESQRSRLWLCVTWLNDEDVLFSGYLGDVWRVDGGGGGGGKKKGAGERMLVSEHTRCLFGIACIGSGGDVVTTGTDRHTICWRPVSSDADAASSAKAAAEKQYRVAWKVSGFGGFVGKIDCAAALNPNRIAIGLGDNTLRIWTSDAAAPRMVDDQKKRATNDSSSGGGRQKGPLDTVSFWKGIQERLSAVRCHPELEGVVAYGAKDGRVGVVDTYASSSDKKVHTMLTGGLHRGVVYELEWHRSFLFSLGGDGIILCFDISRPGDAAVRVFGGCKRSEMVIPVFPPPPSSLSSSSPAANADAGRVAVNMILCNMDGRITLNTLVFEDAQAAKKDAVATEVSAVAAHSKLSNCMRWNSARSLLASASEDGTVVVLDYSAAGAASAAAPQIILKRDWSSSALTAASPCMSVCWHPTNDRLLAFAHAGGAATVCDIVSSHVVARARVGFRVLTVGWGGGGTVLVGGEEYYLVVWGCLAHPDYVDDTYVAPEGGSAGVDGGDGDDSGSREEEKKRKGKGRAAAATVKEQPTVTAVAEKATTSGPSPQQQQQQASARGNEWAAPLIPPLKGDAAEVAAMQELWSGNVAGAIDVLVEGNSLNSLWLSLSVAGGRKLWEKTMERQIALLEQRGNYRNASLHYVALGRVDDAVRCYVKGALFAEALTLAKMRLPVEHPVVVEIYTAWAAQLVESSEYVRAAKCYLEIGLVGRCVDALIAAGGGKSDAALLRVASTLAEKHNLAQKVVVCGLLGLALLDLAHHSHTSATPTASALSMEDIMQSVLSPPSSTAETEATTTLSVREAECLECLQKYSGLSPLWAVASMHIRHHIDDCAVPAAALQMAVRAFSPRMYGITATREDALVFAYLFAILADLAEKMQGEEGKKKKKKYRHKANVIFAKRGVKSVHVGDGDDDGDDDDDDDDGIIWENEYEIVIKQL